MKKIVMVCVWTLVIATMSSILCFSTGYYESDHAVFSDVRQRLEWDYTNYVKYPAFRLDDENIQSIELLHPTEHGAVYEVQQEGDVMFDAYVDSRGKAVPGLECQGKVMPTSFWHRLDDKGVIHFNWMRLWEDINMVIAIYVLPIVVIVLIVVVNNIVKQNKKVTIMKDIICPKCGATLL